MPSKPQTESHPRGRAKSTRLPMAERTTWLKLRKVAKGRTADHETDVRWIAQHINEALDVVPLDPPSEIAVQRFESAREIPNAFWDGTYEKMVARAHKQRQEKFEDDGRRLTGLLDELAKAGPDESLFIRPKDVCSESGLS